MKFLCVYPTHSDQYAIHSTSVFNVLSHSEEHLKKKKKKEMRFLSRKLYEEKKSENKLFS